jgi:hypothetical protein
MTDKEYEELKKSRAALGLRPEPFFGRAFQGKILAEFLDAYRKIQLQLEKKGEEEQK